MYTLTKKLSSYGLHRVNFEAENKDYKSNY